MSDRARRVWTRSLTVVFLAAIAWFAHFSGWRQIGFFSDDHSFAVTAMGWSPGDALHMVNVLAFSYPEPQGRPLGFLLGLELPYLGYRAAGVFGMFAVGWVILSGNAVLLYALLAQRLPRPLPLVAALLFLLFPADTTRSFLCHAHILQPSLTFALVAAHLLLCEQWWLRAMAYHIAALCLVTYETALLPLLTVPLLDGMGTPRQLAAGESLDDNPGSKLLRPLRLRRFVVNGVVLAALIGIVAITRAHGGEYRAVGAAGGKGTVIAEVILGSVRGPLAVAQASVRRPWQQFVGALHRPAHAAIIAAVAMMCGIAVTVGQKPVGRLPVRRAMLFGVAALGVSYLLCFTHYPPTCQEGQSTSVHTAAAIGASALGAGLVGWMLGRWRRATVVGLSIYIGLLFGHALDEQGAYARLWHERQSFWTQVVALCPDMTDRTVILCDGTMPQWTWYMPVNLWSDAMVPAQLYRFPVDYRLPPILAAYPRTAAESWRTAVQRDAAGRLAWRVPPCNCPVGQELTEGNTILLRLDNAGRMVRVAGTVDVEGRPFQLRAPPIAGLQAPFPRLPFYDVLIGANGK